jgi:hypothetical protein
MPIRHVVVRAAVAASLMSAVLGAQGRGTIVRDNSETAIVPTQTLSERLAGADAVAIIRVLTPGRVEVIDVLAAERRRWPTLKAGSLPEVYAVYQTEVVRVLKGDSTVGAVGVTLNVAQRGGEGVWQGQRVVDATGYPPLVRGREYLAFLTNFEGFEGKLVNPFDVFEIESGRIRPNRFSGRTRHGQELADRPVADLVNSLGQ